MFKDLLLVTTGAFLLFSARNYMLTAASGAFTTISSFVALAGVFVGLIGFLVKARLWVDSRKRANRALLIDYDMVRQRDRFNTRP